MHNKVTGGQTWPKINCSLDFMFHELKTLPFSSHPNGRILGQIEQALDLKAGNSEGTFVDILTSKVLFVCENGTRAI